MFTKMNNECTKFPKINTSVPSTSTNSNCSNGNSYITSTAKNTYAPTSYSSVSPPPLSSTSYSASPAQFDVTVSAIAAVVNASNHLPVTTPSSAAAVVAVAVSSLAAAIIPDTPIVSIAGSTLSEITTTTTSTKTTPTPVPTSQEADCSYKNYSNIKGNQNTDLENNTLPFSTIQQHKTSKYFNESVKDLNPMSVADSSTTGELTNASTTATNASAADIDNNTLKQTKNNKNSSITTKASTSICSESVVKTDSDSAPAAKDVKSVTIISSRPKSIQSVVVNTNTNKAADTNAAPSKSKTKDFLSESWEESRLKDWDDSKLKELLDEAYSYKNPRDKENKSKTFLQLLEKAENEDQSYPFRVTSRGSRNLSSSITSNSYHHQNTHYSQSHNHNRSHHHHKQGGSLQDLFEIGLYESQLDCDQSFGIGISGNQRTRRQNHNSRQKKYSSSVSSRQREGGSLPSNVNVTNDIGFIQHESCVSNIGGGAQTTPSNTGKANKKDQRRNASKAASLLTSTSVGTEIKEDNSINGFRESITVSDIAAIENINSSYTYSSGDFIIDMGEPLINIQQQQKILDSLGKDATTQGHSFYERLSNSDKRIPRANIIGSTKSTCGAPTTSQGYVDETVRFNTLERNVGTNNVVAPSTIDATYLPLNENYKSCISVLGDGDQTPEVLSNLKSDSIYTKVSSPASSSAAISGVTNNIATVNQRQLDENGNALAEMQHNACSAGGSGSLVWKQINSVSPSVVNAPAGAGPLNSCGNVSASATVTISPQTMSTTVSTSATVTTTFTSGSSQAKAKSKKKSQQERNTKTVNVESLAGYRGKDPVGELVKYIESSGEDKQGVGSGSKSGDKKKERKKDKEKHQKLKKSNSLEELRSGAKMEMHELKRTAATTESNTVLVRQKTGGGKQNKNNSSSTVDINKNLESRSQTQNANSRKSDRRSWGNEDLKSLEDEQNANLTNEEKTISTSANNTNLNKDRKSKGAVSSVITSSKEEKETKDKIIDRIERTLTNISSASQNVEKLEKSDKPDKIERSDKSEKVDIKIDKTDKRKKQDIPPNAVTVVDIQAIESVLPETAEFHVVTKKKKPKKQKIINNLEETTVTFNRTHNFTMQRTSTFSQQQQQMTVRYKYYHHDNPNNPNTSISNMNANSQYHHQLSSAQHQQQSTNYNSNVSTINSHHQNQQSISDNFSNTDKNRRKSTSSVPPSEKSDSSDLDSVHSLPIESIKAANTTTSATTSLKQCTKQRVKASKNNNTSLGSNNTALSKNQNTSVPISYADIARTNKEINDAAVSVSASGILINNNETSIECRNADTTVTQSSLATESLNDDKPMATTTTTTIGLTAITSGSSLPSKPQKAKKSQIKQDFPELVGSSVINDDKNVSLNTSNKSITYSQSLTAIKHNSQKAASVLNRGSSGFHSGSDTSPTSSTDFDSKSSPTELHKNVIVYQHANTTPVQHSQLQILQKSKSVESDFITSMTNLSSATYLASLNSNNLDQQYPALEKTVKRHSSSNVSLNSNASNYSGLSAVNSNISCSNHTPFNFAAAAKQPIASSYNEQHNTNTNKNSALTTSNTNTNNTTQMALHTNANSNVNAVININGNGGSAAATISSNNNTVNKKSKEKSPPLSSPNSSTQTQHNIVDDCIETSANINTNLTMSTTSVTNSKKSKKERQQQLLQQQQQQQYGLIDNNTQAKQINSNVNISSRKPSKTPLKSSNSLPLVISTSSCTSSSNAISANRPAVIILNDDRSSSSCAADNQFTFGDFNEEELKLFDDDNNVAENALDNIDFNQTDTEKEKHQYTGRGATIKSPTMAFFNDSGTSCGISNSDILLNSSVEASSPNASFVPVTPAIKCGISQHIPTSCGNQSSDRDICADKSKLTNKIHNVSSGSKQNIKQEKMTPTKEEDNKLNSFLTNTRCTSVHTSMDNLEPQLPPPQQLETCNEIETAIIAAARAAARHQQPAHYHQLQQQQQCKNSNASSSSSSFSSSSTSSAVYHHHHSQQHHNSNNKGNYPNQHGSILSSYSHQSQQPQYEEDYKDENESFTTNTPRNCSPSRPRRISIAGGTMASKEFAIHFIPPKTMPTAFSTQQHTDIIIDFIGSAWEEVANSKVTIYYDGQ